MGETGVISAVPFFHLRGGYQAIVLTQDLPLNLMDFFGRMLRVTPNPIISPFKNPLTSLFKNPLTSLLTPNPIISLLTPNPIISLLTPNPIISLLKSQPSQISLLYLIPPLSPLSPILSPIL